MNYTPTNSAYTTVIDEEGNEVRVLNTCHHTGEFMTQPGIDGIIAAEQAAAVQAAQAAQAAAAAAGEQAAAGTPDTVVNEVPENVAAGN